MTHEVVCDVIGWWQRPRGQDVIGSKITVTLITPVLSSSLLWSWVCIPTSVVVRHSWFWTLNQWFPAPEPCTISKKRQIILLELHRSVVKYWIWGLFALVELTLRYQLKQTKNRPSVFSSVLHVVCGVLPSRPKPYSEKISHKMKLFFTTDCWGWIAESCGLRK